MFDASLSCKTLKCIEHWYCYLNYKKAELRLDFGSVSVYSVRVRFQVTFELRLEI